MLCVPALLFNSQTKGKVAGVGPFEEKPSVKAGTLAGRRRLGGSRSSSVSSLTKVQSSLTKCHYVGSGASEITQVISSKGKQSSNTFPSLLEHSKYWRVRQFLQTIISWCS